MSVESLRSRIAAGENETTEFKSTAHANVIGPAICAFLNADGGTVFCGVTDEGELVGVPDARAAAQALELSLKKTISPTPYLTADTVTIGGVEIVVLDVPKGSDPPYVRAGAVWVRSGLESRPATIEALRAMLRLQGESPERWERRLSPSMAEEDLDFDEVRATVREAEESGRFSFTEPADDRLVLKDLSVLAPLGITNAGDALFSTAPIRRHPQCRVQLLVFEGDKAGSEYADNRLFKGPMVRVCRSVVDAIEATNSVRSRFLAGSLQRVDQPAYDSDAIREGVVNAFVHRDYEAYSGGLKVSVYRDRIEIWNSGTLPQGLKPIDLRRDHASILVNPDIAQVFYLRGFMERVGRGTELIAKASKRLGALPPQWRDSGTGVTLTIYSSHRQPEPRREPNARQRALLASLEIGEVISLRDYQRRFAGSISERQARRDLDDLVKNGYIEVLGAGPSTAYRRDR
ncbi:MAG TPA: RNA-binding domain-containing protein [Allosphingosinicella sp.]|jgi:ATP-dependent DNA helicase RecG